MNADQLVERLEGLEYSEAETIILEDVDRDVVREVYRDSKRPEDVRKTCFRADWNDNHDKMKQTDFIELTGMKEKDFKSLAGKVRENNRKKQIETAIENLTAQIKTGKVPESEGKSVLDSLHNSLGFYQEFKPLKRFQRSGGRSSLAQKDPLAFAKNLADHISAIRG